MQQKILRLTAFLSLTLPKLLDVQTQNSGSFITTSGQEHKKINDVTIKDRFFL